jgi:hypothetical protein
MDFNSRIAQFRAEVNDLNTSAALDWRLFLGGYNLRRVAATGWSESERGTIACTVARRRKGSPDWMRHMVYGFFGYAMVNFLFFMTKAPNGGSGGESASGSVERILGALDGVLFRRARHPLFCCSYGG